MTTPGAVHTHVDGVDAELAPLSLSVESDGDDTHGSLRRVLDALSCVPWPQVCVEACCAATMLASAPPLSATVLFVQMRQKSSTTAHHAVMEFERSFDASKEADALSASALARTDSRVVDSKGDEDEDEDEDEMRSFETLMSSMLKERSSPFEHNAALLAHRSQLYGGMACLCSRLRSLGRLDCPP